jgi:hypothetical protein
MLPSNSRSYAKPSSALLTAKPLGSDGLRAQTQIHEMTADGFHEWIRAAHEGQSRRSAKPRQRDFEQGRIDPTASVLRPTRGVPGQAQQERESTFGCIPCDQLLTEDHITPVRAA